MGSNREHVSDVGNEPKFRVGLGGNYYVWCAIKGPVVDVARTIGRSPNGVYYRDDYGVWVLRIPNKARNNKQRESLWKIFKGEKDNGT